MKLKLVIVGLLMLGSTACVTSTNSYTRDIVYRDGSYYSPADDQNGDYYYEPEPDYSYDDGYDAYYGFQSSFYGNPWYGYRDAYRCRFSYHHDRYCNNGWGSFFLNFGGISLIFGNSGYYDYGHGYGYGYPYSGHDGHYSPRPRPVSGPIPMPKPIPIRRGNPIVDTSVNTTPGVRVPGEPRRMPTKPGIVEQEQQGPIVDSPAEANPYTRVRQPRQNIPPARWRDRDDANAVVNDGIPILRQGPNRRQAKPLPYLDPDANPQPDEKPVRQHRLQPYPANTEDSRGVRKIPTLDVQTDEPTVQTDRVQRAERTERPERTERSERSAPTVRREKRIESSDDR